MARKDLLKGLMSQSHDQTGAIRDALANAEVGVAPPFRKSTGAIGAVSQGIADLKARAVVEVNTDLIHRGGIMDRLEMDGIDELAESIRTYGQQVPILLRRIRTTQGEDAYEVVYGRRRLEALRRLGLPAKALIRELTDEQVILAQGQENAARKDLSFIEKVTFAKQMADLGYDRKAICDALHVDKTVISRMLSVADKIPVTLIIEIGAAPSVGRDRWVKLADAIKGRSFDGKAQGDTSDQRFESIWALVMAKAARAPKAAETLNTEAGEPLAQVRQTGKAVMLNVQDKEFGLWLTDQLARLHREWSGSQDG